MSLFLSMLTNLCNLLVWKRSHFPFRVATTSLGTMSPYSPQATSITETTVENCVYFFPEVLPIWVVTHHLRILGFTNCYLVSAQNRSHNKSIFWYLLLNNWGLSLISDLWSWAFSLVPLGIALFNSYVSKLLCSQTFKFHFESEPERLLSHKLCLCLREYNSP